MIVRRGRQPKNGNTIKDTEAMLRRNSEIGIFFRQKSKKLYKVWRILKTGILSDADIFHFDGYSTDILKLSERKSGMISLGPP